MTKEEEILQSMKYWPDSNNTDFQFQMAEDTVEFVRQQFKDKKIFENFSGRISLTKTGNDKMCFQGGKDQACEVLSSIFDCCITTELFDRYITDPPPQPPTPAINTTPPPLPSQNSQGKRQQKPNNRQNTNNNWRQGSKQGGSQKPNGKNNPNHSSNKSSNNPRSDRKDASKAEAILSRMKYWTDSETSIVIEDEDQNIKNAFKEKKVIGKLEGKLSRTNHDTKHSQFNVDDPSLLFDLTSKALSILFDTEITEDLLRKHISRNPTPTKPTHQTPVSKPQASHAKHSAPPPAKHPAPSSAKQPTTRSTSQPAPPPTRPDVISLNSQQYMKLLEKCGLPPNSPPITTLIFMPNSD